ncbi:hypothetical protein OAU50_00820 [Planctomycetota bacterium]|nr:hypothetical protein [Planctomycetota bacterium]
MAKKVERIAGFVFHTKTIYWAVLDGPRASVKLIGNDKIGMSTTQTPPEFVAWAYTVLNALLVKYKPDRVGYLLTRGLDKNDQIFRIYYGLAELNHAAHKQKMETFHVAKNSLQPQLMGQSWARGDDLDSKIDALFSPAKTPWNQNIRIAVSVALRQLP